MRYLSILLVLAGAAALRAGDKPSDPVAGSSGEDALFGDMPEVVGAALHLQTLAEAPASVTVITQADIRKYGYRTLGDVLASARGFTVTSDHITQSSGVRGFAVPGDINTCFLVMINGHPMTEIVGDSNSSFGQDFGLDLDLVERIEIIRGPSSALYGSNGILATINIVTKAPVDGSKLTVSTESGSGGPQKVLFMSSVDLGKGANLLIEGSGFLSEGQNLFVPGFDTSAQGNGIANHVDGQSGYHTFANLEWGAWNFTGYFNDDLERTPILGNGTQFNDQGQFSRIGRNFAGATYTHDYAGGGQLHWETYFDEFRYQDRYDYVEAFGILDNRDSVTGDWISSQLTYSHPVARVGLLTVGLSGKVEIHDMVQNEDYSPDRTVNLNICHPDRTIAPFAQQEWNLAQHWTAYLGGRFDVSHNYGTFLSPRVALVYQPTTRTSYKLVYGRPFRTPSVYEQYYQDGISQVANLRLRPETADTVELSAERKLGKSAYGLVDAYHYALRSVIQAVWISDSLIQYQNAGAYNSNGIDFELGGRLAPWLETTASLSLDRAVNAGQPGPLPNAPGRIAKVRGAVPIFRDRIYFSADLQYLSARLTMSGASTRPVALVNATVSSNKLFHRLDFVAGVRNALNWGYTDPIALPLDASVDQIPANGRTAFVKLIWRQGE
jgi:iron complex outermembrane receptor protein